MSKKPSLAETHPDLAKQWHPTKNGDLTPSEVSQGSAKKVWWKCPKGGDHEWEAAIVERKNGTGCSICAGKKIVKSNSLKTLDPKLAKEWHPTKNGNLSPENIGIGSAKKVWWKCPKGGDHEWEAAVVQRKNNFKKCPICNSFGYQYPTIAKEWHPTKNSKSPYEITKGSNFKAWWKCPKGDDHVWKASPNTRTNRKSGCPFCSGLIASQSTSLKVLHPKLSQEWHPIKNQKLKPENVRPGSDKKVWWKCPKGDDHEWEATISSRVHGKGCPYCSGHKASAKTSLLNRNLQLANEFHPTKNKNLRPENITLFSHKKVWWICSENKTHIWKATVANRAKGDNCPICAGLIVNEDNCLAKTHPKIAKQWHPTKNGKLTPFDIHSGNQTRKIWWKCDKGDDHEWQTKTNQRKNGTGCPFCHLTPQSKQELIITFELSKFYKDINPKGYKTRLNGKLRAIDIFIPDLNLAIEFDGSYWHKDKRAIDKIKSEMLMDEGYKVIRIREQPLKKIHDNDIISKLPYNGKEITDNILKRIMELYSVKDSMKRKIQNYITKDGLQNEKALDKYIDQILEEKAAKKK